jgi:lipoyl(octanoyl) transferase
VTGDWKNQERYAGTNAASEKVFTESRSTRRLLVVDLGFISHAESAGLQNRLIAARKADAIEDVCLLCEHPHVITLGRNAKRENLLASERVLHQKNVELRATNRGGDITYHGPGQIVAYPILNLAEIRRDVGWYVRMLEETMIRATSDYGILAAREAGKTGIWVSNDLGRGPAEKLGAIGVHLSRWVTSHGLAYNVSTDLRYFDLIVPCGIADRKATSLEKLTGRAVDKREVAASLVKHFAEIFGFQTTSMTIAELLDRLRQIETAVARQELHPAAVSA